MSLSASTCDVTASRIGWYDKLSGEWHKVALNVLMAIVLAHWAEHIAQAWQVYALNWPRHQAGGVLGLFFPWLVCSELLHYGYALIMLVGMWVVRRGFLGVAGTWWMIALSVQVWHHFEHALLLGQVAFHRNLFGSAAPTSLVQFFVPRIELHLFYNTIVFIPMVIGVYYHLFPPQGHVHAAVCSCSRRAQQPATEPA